MPRCCQHCKKELSDRESVGVGGLDLESCLPCFKSALRREGAKSMLKALGVEPAGDGYVFLRGLWDANDDSIMLSKKYSSPHAWAAINGEDMEQEVDDGK